MRRLLLLPSLLLLVVLLPDVATASSPAPRASYRWPLAGTPAVTAGFQPPRTAWGAGHRGVDLRGAAGDEVVAAGTGTVSYAGLLAGRGVVVVSHPGGLRTTYEPVAATVHVGDEVAGGEPLGTLTAGHASCGTATCLHWGLLRGTTYLDPLSLLGLHGVRLLPLRTADRAAAWAAGADQAAAASPAGAATAGPSGAAPRAVRHGSALRRAGGGRSGQAAAPGTAVGALALTAAAGSVLLARRG